MVLQTQMTTSDLLHKAKKFNVTYSSTAGYCNGAGIGNVCLGYGW